MSVGLACGLTSEHLRALGDEGLMRLQLSTLCLAEREEADVRLLDALGREWQRRKRPFGLRVVA